MLRRLTIARTLTIIVWLLIPLIGARVQTDTDMWWQLRSAEQNIAEGRIVQEERFAYTCPGAEGCAPTRIQHEWLGQPVLLAFWSLLGGAGVGLYAVITAMIGMAFINGVMPGGPYLKAFLLALGAFSASIFWVARPLMLSFVLAGVTLWLVYSIHRKGRTRLAWVLPPMFALWGNLHGGWPQGALILLAAAAGMLLNLAVFRRVSPRRYDDTYGVLDDEPSDGPTLAQQGRLLLMFLVPCLLAAILLPLLNPYGTSMLSVPFDTVGFDFQPIYIDEWRAPTLSRSEMWPYFVLLAVTVLVMALDWRRADFVEIIMVAGTAYMSLGAARHIAFFTQVALIPLAIHAANLGADRGIRFARTTRVTPVKAGINIGLIVGIGLVMVTFLAARWSPKVYDETLRARLPVDAVAAMVEMDAPQPLFNSWNWGGYIIYFARDYRVFIDGRADLYRDFTWRFFETARGDDTWRNTFAAWDIKSVLIEPNITLAGVLRAEPGWRVAYEDDIAVLFIREDA